MLFPLDAWLVQLAKGWHLPFVVEPCGGHHRWSDSMITLVLRPHIERDGTHRDRFEARLDGKHGKLLVVA